MEPDHDEPPGGEGERQEDGGEVDHHGEADVEHHEDAPGKRVLKTFGLAFIGETFLFLPTFSLLILIDPYIFPLRFGLHNTYHVVKQININILVPFIHVNKMPIHIRSRNKRKIHTKYEYY